MMDFAPAFRPVDNGPGFQFCFHLWVRLQEFRYHIIERNHAYPQVEGIDKQAGHDKYVTLVFAAGLSPWRCSIGD